MTDNYGIQREVSHRKQKKEYFFLVMWSLLSVVAIAWLAMEHQYSSDKPLISLNTKSPNSTKTVSLSIKNTNVSTTTIDDEESTKKL